MANKIKLPKSFEQTELTYGPTFEDGEEILFNYCKSCKKKPNCQINVTLRHAMGENFPYWAKAFVAVEVPTQYEFFTHSKTKVMCKEYESPQLKLSGIQLPFSDGVERLVEIAEKEKQSYLKEVENVSNISSA